MLQTNKLLRVVHVKLLMAGYMVLLLDCMFKNKDSLRDHERRIHEKRSYPCNYCELEFPERTQRCRHEKRNHTEYGMHMHTLVF